MRFSRAMKSSSQCLPSPDGAYIATLLPSKLSIRETRSLETMRVISLPQELSSSITWFLWSASSTRLLVASKENIRVYSITDAQFSANITHPTSGTSKIAFVTFGAIDDEICIFSEFGLKLIIINLQSSKSVEISAPKFYTPGTASKGCAYRPSTRNMALLTRHGGKDVISIHARETFEVTRSWNPDTVDAQALSWSPDGRWLVVWESLAHGHMALVYTADGHLFRRWNGPTPVSDEEVDSKLGAGTKLFDWSKTGTNVAVGDFSGRISVLATPSFTESMCLFHTTTIKPAENLQIWQEQVSAPQPGTFEREFVLATVPTCPPTSDSSPNNSPESRTGTNLLAFDNSDMLLATRTENMPTTLWIWDVSTRILRAVLIFHAPIAKATWHPSIDELLLVRCEDDGSRSLVHLWDPSWASPRIVDFAPQFIGGKVLGKTIARWLNVQSTTPAIFFSDTQDCILTSFAHEQIDGDIDETLPWGDAEVKSFDIYGNQEESPLTLVPADENLRRMQDDEDEAVTRLSGGSEDVDDTFRFKKFVEPAKSEGNPWT